MAKEAKARDLWEDAENLCKTSGKVRDLWKGTENPWGEISKRLPFVMAICTTWSSVIMILSKKKESYRSLESLLETDQIGDSACRVKTSKLCMLGGGGTRL